MGCGASSDTSRVQEPTLNKKSVLPPIDPHPKKKIPSAKSNTSNDSGIEDSEPVFRTKPPGSKIPVPIDNLHVEHHQKSRLGHGETFDIIATPKPGSLAPLRHVPKFLMTNKPTPSVDSDLQAKIAAKQERASRKRQEIEEARRLASSRIGHRPIEKSTVPSISTPEPLPATTTSAYSSKHNERQQHLAMLRDKLRHTGSSNGFHDSMPSPHTPRTPRNDSVSSGMTDVANLTPRRGAPVIGATKPSNFKPVYD
ncbi:unnamed protein product [Adineta ricciae]|nr:unnamed protein product [Adineta ricciae]